VNWFEHLGKSLQWTLAPTDRTHPLLSRIRSEHAKRRRFSRRLAQSPLAPESTWRLAQTLQKQHPKLRRWAILDDDHHLAWSLRQNSIEADAFVIETPHARAAEEGLASHHENTFWAQNWLTGFTQAGQTYPGIVVDTLHMDNMLHFALLRAQEILEPGGICAVMHHPWQRAFMQQIAAFLNFELVCTHAESLMRYGPHFAPHEILWDITWYRVHQPSNYLDPAKTYSRKAAKNLEPSSHLVGAGTLDLLPAQNSSSLSSALHLLQKGAKIKVLSQETRHENTFWTLPNGGHMVLRHPAPSGRFQVDFSPWRPRLLTQFTTAMLTHFARPSPYMELP
jgi:hypothetical protein